MAPILGYWKIRGLAQPIRLLLHYFGEKFTDELYEAGGPPDFSRESWLSHKFSRGLDFPNLPYFIDGDFKITQSSAILEYIADKHGMLPDTSRQRAILHMLQSEIQDARSGFTFVCYSKDFGKLKGDYLKNLPSKLESWSTFLGTKEWLLGKKINYADFNLYDLLVAWKTFEPKCLDKFPSLQSYVTRFEELPKIKEYIKSDGYLTKPFNNTVASWRGDA